MGRSRGNTYPGQPRVGVGAITIRDGKVLLIRRGVEPGRGLWAIPGGTLRLGESMPDCARREILEETGVEIEVCEIAYVFDFIERDNFGKIKFHFVIVDFSARHVSGEAKAADDAVDARWFSAEELKRVPVSVHTIEALRNSGFFGLEKGKGDGKA
ncbi:MAG TPA: NUDIX hydrolase [Smithella sp.]|nr:NUDIX hydrolase [Smithella sp.]